MFATVVGAATLTGCIDMGIDPPAFTAQPNPAQTGETVTFDTRDRFGRSSVDKDAKVAWDLDGDGSFETSGGRLVQTKVFTAPGDYPVTIDVGNPATFLAAVFALAGIQFYIHDYETVTVSVRDPAPTAGEGAAPIASFDHDAGPGHTGTPVRFDASASSDADGEIASFKWDLGDGSTDTTRTPVMTHAYDEPGQYMVELRVVDDSGQVGETQRMVQVVAAQDKPEPDDDARSASSRGVTAVVRPSAMMDEGVPSMASGALLRTGMVARGRLSLRGRLPAPLATTVSPTWVANFMLKLRGHGRSRTFAVEGHMLIDFGSGGRLCVGARAGGGTAQDTGRLTVLGGSGAAARIAGSGTFTSTIRAAGPTLKTNLKLAERDVAVGLPPACRTLARAARR
jgi:PKD repeat protein